MNEIVNPILMFIAIILTMIASFTAFDLLSLLKTAKRNTRFLFLGSVFSMGIGIWVTSFFGVLARDMNGLQSSRLVIIALSAITGLILTALAFYVMNVQNPSIERILCTSFLMALSALSIHAISMYGMKLRMNFDAVLFAVSGMMIFSAFAFSLWILFDNKRYSHHHIWLKPISSCIVTAAIIESHFLLMRSVIFSPSESMQFSSEMHENLMMYIMLLASIIILGSLVVSTTLISKRLAASDINLKDIKFALDQSSIVAFTNQKGVITSMNDKFCEISKYSRDELIGQDHRILNSNYHPKEFFKDMWKTIGQGRVWEGEIRNKAKDGTHYWVETTIVPFVNKQGKPYQYLAIRNDITERKKAEELLRRQDKLAVVGQMAAGIAHEIRNPLTSMKGFAEFLQLDEENKERREYLDIILDEADRINEIVEDFLVLAKPKVVQLKNQNIVPIVQDVVMLMEFEAQKKSVHLHLACKQNTILAECDENRLKQVFLNFVKNGIEAMPDGGDLYVKIAVTGVEVKISIQDTGVGISEEKLKQLGDPFFTTKKNGNGLGLMVSFKIIEGHNGHIYVESEVNKGATFNVVLPAKTT
ncbi:ATP-binding protein [Ectobacillus panaciterrae]|uniref:ATP-binding protein n=1 Tax=Ectobacillus panaciterrae TaxID=363872 RepID=UPI000407AFC3|nr:ATP-binding protein [Ectobacillus panaciterrae]